MNQKFHSWVYIPYFIAPVKSMTWGTHHSHAQQVIKLFCETNNHLPRQINYTYTCPLAALLYSLVQVFSINYFAFLYTHSPFPFPNSFQLQLNPYKECLPSVHLSSVPAGPTLNYYCSSTFGSLHKLLALACSRPLSLSKLVCKRERILLQSYQLY